MTKAELVSITGSPLVDGWPQVISNHDQSLICALAIKGSNAKNIGQEIIEEVKQFQPSSIGQLHNFLLDLLTKLREQEVRPQLALVWLPTAQLNSTKITNNSASPNFTASPAESMILATYQGKIILKRKQKIGRILASDTEIKIIQGTVRDHDQIILSTKQSLQIEQSLRQLFKQPINHKEIAQQLQRKIRMLVDSSLTSVALVQLKHQTAADLSFTQLRQSTEDQDSLKSATTSSTQKDEAVLINPEDESIPLTAPTPDQSTADKIKPVQTATATTQAVAVDANNQDATLPEVDMTTENPDKEIKIKISLEPVTALLKKISHKLMTVIKQGLSTGLPKIKQAFNSSITKLKNIQEKKRDELSQVSVEKSSNSTNLATTNSNSQFDATISINSKNSVKNSLLASIEQVVNRLTSLPKKIKTIFFTKNVYLENKSSKKIIRVVTIIIIAVILLAGTGLIIRNLINNQKTQAQTAVAPALELLAQAEQVMNNDIILARDKTAEAIELMVIEQKELSGQRFTRNFFEEQLATAREFYDQISGMIEVAQLEIFFDIREVSANFLISAIDINNQGLVALDQEQQTAVYLDLDNKQSAILTLEFMPQDLTASNDRVYFLGNGVHDLEFEAMAENANLRELKTEGDSDRDAIFIDFFEGYLYAFNPDKRNIYRYIVRQNELSEPIGWLTNKQNIKFDQISSMVVDGRIWLADANGTIIKLERGEPIEFNITGLHEAFGSSIKLYANSTTTFLYVLEPEKSRVVILSPEGEFMRQITSPSLASATQLVVNEERNQAFAVSGSIIYLIEL